MNRFRQYIYIYIYIYKYWHISQAPPQDQVVNPLLSATCCHLYKWSPLKYLSRSRDLLCYHVGFRGAVGMG